MIEKKIDTVFILLTGRATLLELKIKLLLSQKKFKVKGTTCSEVKNIMYDKFSEYLTEKNKKIIDDAVWIRNKLVHFELREILKKQKSIHSVVVSETTDPKNASSIIEAMKKISEGKSNPVNEESSLYGQYLEFSLNSIRVQKLNDILDEAIDVVTRIVIESNKKIK